MVKEIVVILDTGLPVFHYGVTGERKLDELVSGFLSAMGSFAEEIGGEKVRVIAFAENKFVWVKKGNLIFIALVSQADSAEIYRVILQDLSEQFVSKYYAKLMEEYLDVHAFKSFSEAVEHTLQRFDGIPGLARRYKTALLPVDDINSLKQSLATIEEDPDILRGGAITHEGFVVVSNLRTYELEAILDLMSTFENKASSVAGILVVHTSLDPVTSFYVVNADKKGICVFVVNKGLSNDEYSRIIQPFVKLFDDTSFEKMKKVFPTRDDETLSFYDHDLVTPQEPVSELLEGSRVSLSSMKEEMYEHALIIIETLRKVVTIDEIHDITRLPREEINEILAFLIAKGLVVISQIFPVMDDRDERFSAYLEVIGIPKSAFDIVDSIWKYCNGSFSVREISEKTRIPTTRIIEVLRALGRHVKWETERVLSRVG